MKTYTFEVIVREGDDEFWENIKGTGCDEVFTLLDNLLFNGGFSYGDDCGLKLVKYEDK